jgi:hypothetical protein
VEEEKEGGAQDLTFPKIKQDIGPPEDGLIREGLNLPIHELGSSQNFEIQKLDLI